MTQSEISTTKNNQQVERILVCLEMVRICSKKQDSMMQLILHAMKSYLV